MRRALILIAFATAPALAHAQYCPSYTPTVAPTCRYFPVAGTNPTVGQWQGIFDVVARGPAAWGNQGPAVADITKGCGNPTPPSMGAAEFPCEILKAIARVETGWLHFCVPTAPASQVGAASRTIVSFDCGYGIGQVTSGMRAADPKPSFDPMRVVAEPTYNLATGTQILAQKWRGTECVGDRNPQVIEDWYTSAWAYNGLSFKNNPANPMYSSTRGVWDPKVGGAAPYQEKVFGYVEHPPTPQHWTAVALAYPAISETGMSGKPGALSEPACESPTSCRQKRGTHISACFGAQDMGTTPAPDLSPVADLASDAPVADMTVPNAGHAPGGCDCHTAGAPLRSDALWLLLVSAVLWSRRRLGQTHRR